MEYQELKGWEPKEFFRWFGEISRIPRESRHEEKIIAFCQKFAEERGLPCETDAKGNVLMRVPATKG